jgi:phosphatidylserine decarboxylase
MLIPIFVFINIHIRFWRSPKRNISKDITDIVSPADGRIIYINRLDEEGKLESNKRGTVSELSEIAKTDLSPKPCWQIGINMTPFDVHKNCSPIEGTIIFSKHFDGKFLSLKNQRAVSDNERHTYVIENDRVRVAMVQIASKRVRRIDTYVKEGDSVKKGSWLGMIRFGSQVDIFIPIECNLLVVVGQQLYAGSVVIAKIPNIHGDGFTK